MKTKNSEYIDLPPERKKLGGGRWWNWIPTQFTRQFRAL